MKKAWTFQREGRNEELENYSKRRCCSGRNRNGQASDPTVQMIGQIVSVIGAILLGLFAKDSNVTGS